jgi:hypothetical protein
MTERFETTGTAAIRAGVTSSAIIKAGDRGQLAVAARTTAGQRLYRRVDVDAYAAKNRMGRRRHSLR